MTNFSVLILCIVVWLYQPVGLFARNLPVSKQCDTRIGIFEGKMSTSNIQAVCRKAYVSLIAPEVPAVTLVYYRLNRMKTLGCETSRTPFQNEGGNLGLATVAAYNHSGYDRGHMMPAADAAWDPEVAEESYYMANVAAQRPEFNRGVWKQLESAIRTYVFKSNKDVLVITGAVYSTRYSRTSKNLPIPTAYYKLILDATDQLYAAWYLPHIKVYNKSEDLYRYKVSLHDLEGKTSLDLRKYHHYNQILIKSNVEDLKEFHRTKQLRCNSII